ncbi:AAA family ATPase [Limisphaera ngatamarikiensis]|uniref:AAA family ATPase n=1 Tax=Limisphaera ngatamarikiensis TaxID=1324935 RepID=A0A6M1RZW7_9BACT|nr:AAA family ATPase [Limisphaera ngatamarikiensis]NGO38660.1 AAA family ATPase [Limisphaera ngatamarikiensis]
MLERIVLQGYKSIENADVSLRRINVLIGANGAGKSNFVSLFRFMNRLVSRELQTYVAQAGGADQLLHYGRKTTERLHIELWFRQDEDLANRYECTLLPTADDFLVFQEEGVYFHSRQRYERPYLSIHSDQAHKETLLMDWRQSGDRVAYYVLSALNSWQVYHFHDTSASAKVKQTGDLHDNLFLRPNASNLAAYLYLLRETQQAYYRNIVETVRLAAPFFGDFVLRPSPFNPEKIRLEWQERGSDLLFGPHALSDGTLRLICLATLFLQPPDRLPTTIVLDEPELGLHPYAIALLADMVHSASQHTQVILATQSVTLVNQFQPEDILVVDRDQGKTVFRRLAKDEMTAWLEDYGLGDLWEKNLLGGRPSQ